MTIYKTIYKCATCKGNSIFWHGVKIGAGLATCNVCKTLMNGYKEPKVITCKPRATTKAT